jgi:hypothetical protein
MGILETLFGSSSRDKTDATMHLSMDGSGQVSGNAAYCQAAHGGPTCSNYEDMLKYHPAWAAGYRDGQK